MNTKIKGLLAAAGISCVASGSAFAATTTTTFQVTATVLSACSLNAGTLAFGNYSPASGTDTDASSTINVTCTLLTPYTLKLNGGSVANNINGRMMDAGAATDLGYQLYNNAGRTTVWGDGTTGSTVASTGLGLVARQHTVYGRIVAGQDVPTGSYVDTITVSLDF